MRTSAQCALLFLWIFGLSYGMWLCAKGRPAKPPGTTSDFFLSLFVAVVHLTLLWMAGALSELIGGAR